MKQQTLFKVTPTIYFAPSEKRVFETREPIEHSKIAQDLSFVLPSKTECSKIQSKLLPTDLTILLTTKCNLRCIYCYSEAGDIPMIDIPREPVLSAIKEVSRNAVLLSAASPRKTTIKFTGGGEPTCCWNELVYYVEHINQLKRTTNCRFELTIQTNGQLTDSKKQTYIFKNFDNIIISCDGFGDIQNRNRPRADGKNSWRAISKFLSATSINPKLNIALRTTITRDNMEMMNEICEYFFTNFPHIGYIHLEPMGPSGRGQQIETIDLDLFATKILALEEKYFGRVGTSTFPYSIKNGRYCDSQSGASIVINTHGHSVTCVEKANETLTFGGDWVRKFYQGGTFIENDNVKYPPQVGKECIDCYAFAFCNGGCPLRISRNSEGEKDSSFGKSLCKMQRRFVKEFIIKALDSEALLKKFDGNLPHYIQRSAVFPMNTNVR